MINVKMKKGMYMVTNRHGLQIVFVALSELVGDHGLGLGHVLNGALDRDDTLEVEAVDVIDTGDGDLGVGVLHDPLDGVATLADNTANEVVVSEDLQGDLAAIANNILFVSRGLILVGGFLGIVSRANVVVVVVVTTIRIAVGRRRNFARLTVLVELGVN